MLSINARKHITLSRLVNPTLFDGFIVILIPDNKCNFFIFFLKSDLNIRRIENNSTKVENIEYLIFLEKVTIRHT